MALALNNLKRVDMPLNKETNQPISHTKYLLRLFEIKVIPMKLTFSLMHIPGWILFISEHDWVKYLSKLKKNNLIKNMWKEAVKKYQRKKLETRLIDFNGMSTC